MPIAIHQTLIAAAPGDAVTNSALEMRRLLREVGPSEIYALHIHQDLLDVVRPLSAYPGDTRREPPRMMIVHLSMGDAPWLGFVLSLRCPLGVSYHNITPAAYFDSWDPDLADLLRFGRATMPALAARAELAMADSMYNAEELTAVGFRDVHVAGLIIDPFLLGRVEPDRRVLEDANGRPGPTVLHVGQLFPHKRIDIVLESFAELLTRGRPDATLVLAGASRLTSYRRAVDGLVAELGLTARVVITGGISQQAMSAHYRTADVLVTASDHEGFCVPLVEAMAFDVPIVARGCGAIPETAGDAAVVLDKDRSPACIAIAIDALLSDRSAADALRRRGRRRTTEFTLERQRRRFLEALALAF
jgi:L-malate glycosyltransferase